MEGADLVTAAELEHGGNHVDEDGGEQSRDVLTSLIIHVADEEAEDDLLQIRASSLSKALLKYEGIITMESLQTRIRVKKSLHGLPCDRPCNE